MLLQIPDVLSADEVASLRRDLAHARFEDGRATAGAGAQEAKRNLQLPVDGDGARTCSPRVLEALRRNPLFFSAALPQRMFGPVFNRYDKGMGYGDHLDASILGVPAPIRADVAATLFISAPQDYDGGELVIQDTFGAHRVKLPSGGIIVYPASSHHRVETVTRGSRLAAVLWVQSLVRDEGRRRILFDIDVTIGSLARKAPRPPEIETLSSAYHNLLRMWAES
ncbi:MAG TPA: Fe2+-dependent dioxygenase [Burkholderiales bacterium]|jgi:PKHD-type hydroxylase